MSRQVSKNYLDLYSVLKQAHLAKISLVKNSDRLDPRLDLVREKDEKMLMERLDARLEPVISTVKALKETGRSGDPDLGVIDSATVLLNLIWSTKVFLNPSHITFEFWD